VEVPGARRRSGQGSDKGSVAAIRHGMKYGLIQAMKDGHVNIATHPLRIPDSKLVREVKEIVRDTQKSAKQKSRFQRETPGQMGMY
jgi:hypothetical protein